MIDFDPLSSLGVWKGAGWGSTSPADYVKCEAHHEFFKLIHLKLVPQVAFPIDLYAFGSLTIQIIT